MHQYSLIGLLLSSETYPMPKFLFFGSKILQMFRESQQLCSLFFWEVCRQIFVRAKVFSFGSEILQMVGESQQLCSLFFWRRGKLNDLLHKFLGRELIFFCLDENYLYARETGWRVVLVINDE